MWAWCSFLDHRDPGTARYTGDLVAMGTGDLALLEFSLASGTSAPVRIEYGGDSCLDSGNSGGSTCAGTPAASVQELLHH